MNKMRKLLLQWPLALVLGMLPVLTLFFVQGALSIHGAGVFDWSLVAAGGVLLICAAVSAWVYWAKKREATPEHDAVDLVDVNPAWGAIQLNVWNDSCDYIDTLLAQNNQFDALLGHSLSVLRKVSSSWNTTGNHSEYAASLPEALLATEVLAARYRQVLIQNVPFSNQIKVSQALSAWEIYESHENKVRYAYQAYRVYRVFSIPGVLSEIRSILLSHVTDQASENLIHNLKRAYLQEVASVAIDLYSGNFSRAIDELPFKRDTQRDLDLLAEEVGPIRIVIVGQISSGKSTLTNTILDQLAAESGLVPTTESATAYQFAISEGFDTYIIDTPGVDSDPKSIDAALSKLADADLVVWVMRANQPGRSIDQSIYKAFEDYFEAAPDRQKPIIVVAATHIDCIQAFAGVNEKTLEDVTAPLAEACSRVVSYDLFCPLSLSEPRLGVEGLRNALAVSYERAINTRLNRIRLLKPSMYESASKEMEHLKSGTIEALKLAVKKR